MTRVTNTTPDPERVGARPRQGASEGRERRLGRAGCRQHRTQRVDGRRIRGMGQNQGCLHRRGRCIRLGGPQLHQSQPGRGSTRGGVVRGVGDLATMGGSAMLHPIDAAASLGEGALGIAEHVPVRPGFNTTVKGIHGLVDLARGKTDGERDPIQPLELRPPSLRRALSSTRRCNRQEFRRPIHPECWGCSTYCPSVRGVVQWPPTLTACRRFGRYRNLPDFAFRTSRKSGHDQFKGAE